MVEYKCGDCTNVENSVSVEQKNHPKLGSTEHFGRNFSVAMVKYLSNI